MRLLAIGGSDAGISAALRARELDPRAEVTVVLADGYPNFSICGIPYYVSGDVTHWRNLAHRTLEDLKATGVTLRLDTTVTRIDHLAHRVLTTTRQDTPDALDYDALVVGTGAVPVRPPDRRAGRARARRRGAPPALHGRHLRAHAHPRARRHLPRHRRRRLHRPGDGRGPHRPRPERHPDRTAPRGPAHRRPRTRQARPRRARAPRRHRRLPHPRRRHHCYARRLPLTA
jgi:NADPH-dependent 2,4-dienoyl-CoA reductase/sulfur reductase-like enzyme